MKSLMKSGADSTSSNAALLLCELLKATIRDGPLSRANPRFWITSAISDGRSSRDTEKALLWVSLGSAGRAPRSQRGRRLLRLCGHLRMTGWCGLNDCRIFWRVDYDNFWHICPSSFAQGPPIRIMSRRVGLASA